MPKFGSVFSTLQAKIEEARISDLNYELGKFVQDTKCYLTSFKSQHSFGTAVRSSVPKSTSLPVFPEAAAGVQKSNQVRAVEPLKYQYRSAFRRPPSDEDFIGDIIEEDEDEEEQELPPASALDSTVVEKFIRVFESSSNKDQHSTREDIRKKLAFSRNSDSTVKKAANDLEICFIMFSHI